MATIVTNRLRWCLATGTDHCGHWQWKGCLCSWKDNFGWKRHLIVAFPIFEELLHTERHLVVVRRRGTPRDSADKTNTGHISTTQTYPSDQLVERCALLY
jgi:hypothetical protein